MTPVRFSFKQLENAIRGEEKNLRFILRLMYGPTELIPDTVSAGQAMVLLLWDFFRTIGFTAEQYLAAVEPFYRALDIYGDELVAALQQHTPDNHEPIKVPTMFLSILDNRYTALYSGQPGDTGFWDIRQARMIKAIPEPPTILMTVCCTTLWILSFAEMAGLQSAARAFREGLVCRARKPS